MAQWRTVTSYFQNPRVSRSPTLPVCIMASQINHVSAAFFWTDAEIDLCFLSFCDIKMAQVTKILLLEDIDLFILT